MLWLTDSINKHKVAINSKYVVAVFRIPENTQTQTEYIGKTAINLTTGTIIVDESEFDVVGMINIHHNRQMKKVYLNNQQ